MRARRFTISTYFRGLFCFFPARRTTASLSACALAAIGSMVTSIPASADQNEGHPQRSGGAGKRAPTVLATPPFFLETNQPGACALLNLGAVASRPGAGRARRARRRPRTAPPRARSSRPGRGACSRPPRGRRGSRWFPDRGGRGGAVRPHRHAGGVGEHVEEVEHSAAGRLEQGTERTRIDAGQRHRRKRHHRHFPGRGCGRCRSAAAAQGKSDAAALAGVRGSPLD